jgi:hypothetical protein
MQIAIDAHFHSLALLLLCNGYRLELEPRPSLDEALRRRAWDLVELLLAWGAEPKSTSPFLILDTYRVEVMERFWALGVDYAKGHELADYLSGSTRNRPAYGWARRHHDEPRIARELAMALAEAVIEQREKAVHLLLWAGADAHLSAPYLRWARGTDASDCDDSAIGAAILFGRGSFLKILKPNPARDDFDDLWSRVTDPEAVDCLAAVSKPTDWSPTILHCIRETAFDLSGHLGHRDWKARHSLERIADAHGGRLTNVPPNEMRDLRASMLKMQDRYEFERLIKWLGKPQNCLPAIYDEIARTPAMQSRIESMGIRQRWAARKRSAVRRTQSGSKP